MTNKKIILVAVFLFYLFQGYTQKDKDNYTFLHKIVNNKLKEDGSVFELQENGFFCFKYLKEYYEFKYYNKNAIINYSLENDSLIEADDEKIQLINKDYFEEFELLDNILSKQEYEYLFSQNGKIHWKKWKLHKKINLIEHLYKSNHYRGNYISKPLYTRNNKYAIIWCEFSLGQNKYVVFKKEKEVWKLIGEIPQYFLYNSR